jgi:hypothetical protein
MARAFSRLKSALRKLAASLKREKPAMIGIPPSARDIPADPLAHAREFANEYADYLENYVEGRMHALGVPEEQIGTADKSRNLPWAVFHPNGTTGGAVLGEKIAVDSGIFNPELLTERYGQAVGKTWAKTRLRDRIDAVIAHEIAESQAGTHEGAERLAAVTELGVSEGARRVLRSMTRRTR